MVKTINNVLNYGKEQLKNNNIESFILDSLILLCHILNCDKTYLLVHKNDVITDKEFELYCQCIIKRVNKMPVKYITGICEFMSLDFIVNENVLIPRPDTEILVEEALKEFDKEKSIEILDLCCGSGCIGISLATYLNSSTVLMADISEGAIDVSEKNIQKHHLSERVDVIKKDILNETIDKKYDLIVSNPPYINDDDYKRLEDDVKLYEPEIALNSPSDEYKFYKRIIDVYSENLKDNGIMLLEMGYNQWEFLYNYALSSHKFKEIEIIKDLSGVNRVLKLKRRCLNK